MLEARKQATHKSEAHEPVNATYVQQHSNANPITACSQQQTNPTQTVLAKKQKTRDSPLSTDP